MIERLKEIRTLVSALPARLTIGVYLQQGANRFYEQLLTELAASASLRRNARARRNSPLEPPFRRALASKRNFLERDSPRPNSQKSLWIQRFLFATD
jgi:hypothetical protein